MQHEQFTRRSDRKRPALLARREKIMANGAEPFTIRARVKAEGRSEVRRIRIRDFQMISDSDTDFCRIQS